MSRKHPTIFWIHALHRWVSMAFVISAVLLIFPILPHGPVADVIATVVISLLVLLALTGIWEGVHHYTVKFRAPRRARQRGDRVPTSI